MNPGAGGFTKSSVVLILGAGVLVVSLVLGLVAIGGPDRMADTLTWISSIVVLISGGTSAGALAYARRGAKQTNGSLDARIRDNVRAALDDHLNEKGEG